MTITASALVPKADPIPPPGALREPVAFPLPSWSSPIGVTKTFRTVVQASRTVAEQRFGLTNKPLRTMSFSLRSYSDDQVERVRSILSRMGASRTPFPLYPDVVKLTGKPHVEQNTYTGDFSHKRYYVGGYVCVMHPADRVMCDRFVLRKIVAVTDTSITLDGNVLEEYAVPPQVNHHWRTSDSNFTFFDTSPIFYAREGDIVFSAIASVSGVESSIPTSMLVLDASKDLFDNGTIIYAATNATKDTHTGSGSGYWVCPESGEYFVKWLLASDAVSRLHQSVTVVGNVHPQHPIFSGAGNGNATTDGYDAFVSVPHATTEVQQLALVNFASFAPNDVGLTGLSPSGGAYSDTILDNDRAGIGETIISANVAISADYSFTGDASINIEMALSRDPMFLPPASAVHGSYLLLNPKESTGLVGGFIFPVIECDLEPRSASNALTDRVSDASITVIETPGPSALDAQTPVGSAPSGFDVHGGYPILDLPIHWDGVTFGSLRVADVAISGIGNVVQVFGDRPGATFNLPFLQLSRLEYAQLSSFFDSRGGRLHPFWLFAPVHGIRAVGGTAGTVQLDPRVTHHDWLVYANIGAVRKSTGAKSIHAITGRSIIDGNVALTLSPSLPTADLSDLELSTAHLCRFDTDSFEESWITDSAISASLPVVELINEKNVSASLLDWFAGAGGTIWAPNNDYDPCADGRCGTDNPAGCCICDKRLIVLEAFCYTGQCRSGDLCAGGCELAGSCAVVLQPLECIDGVMQWRNAQHDINVSFNTISKTWTNDFYDSDLIGEGCCGTVDQGLSICACGEPAFGGACNGLPPNIVTQTCSLYLFEMKCNEYSQPSQECNYVPVLRITGTGGNGSPRCA